MKSQSIEPYRDEMIEVTLSSDIVTKEAGHGHLLKSSLPRSDTHYGTGSEESVGSSDEFEETPAGKGGHKRRHRCISWILLCVVVAAAAVVAAVVVTSQQSADSDSLQALKGLAGPAEARRRANPPPFSPISTTESEEVIILGPAENLFPGASIDSPNGRYTFKFTNDGELRLLKSNGDLLWSVSEGGGAKLAMQWDGNLILRSASKRGIWSSKTSDHPDASFRLDNRGCLAIKSFDGVTPLWMEGVPGGQYDRASASSSLTFPIRGIFYYPWFPETWTVGGTPVFYNPTLGKYSNGDRTAQTAHVEALDYAHVDLAIASWWGQNTKKDRARITNLMDKSTQYGIKWTIYHEQERKLQPSVEELRDDLAYLKKWFAWHEAWAHIDGKPLIFVWNHGDCDVSDRWMEAANDEWYIVVKKLDRSDCPSQPDHWHQYGPSNAIVHEEGYSFSVSPGFWQANKDTPNLPRLSADAFRSNVIAMVESGEPWQLITTFNEWGEGTAIESAAEWSSPSGYGIYLDALNEIYDEYKDYNPVVDPADAPPILSLRVFASSSTPATSLQRQSWVTYRMFPSN